MQKNIVYLLVWLVALLSSVQAQTNEPLAMNIGIIVPELEDDSAPYAALYNAVSVSAREGATLAEEEFGFNAQLLGIALKVFIAEAGDAASVKEAAAGLMAEEVFALAGGFGPEQATALSEFANEQQIPFLNLGASSDRLRNEACNPYMLHLEPSAAMYLDALAGWFIRSQFRNWFFVYSDDDEGKAQYERITWTLKNRHFGAREAGKMAVTPASSEFGDSLRAIERSRADVVLMLLSAEQQLEFLSQYEAAGLDLQITGFPDPLSQTRAFFDASQKAAPVAGSGYRATAWEATLDAYGARELNDRYLARWGKPMDPAAWASYQAVKIFFEAASFGATQEAAGLLGYFENPNSVFDIWKGIGVTFRPWDHQLRQPLYLVSLNDSAQTPEELALLVGELPAIYMPQTDPVERLDQLGDLEKESRCRF